MILLLILLTLLTGALFVIAMLKAAQAMDGKDWRNRHPLERQRLRKRPHKWAKILKRY